MAYTSAIILVVATSTVWAALDVPQDYAFVPDPGRQCYVMRGEIRTLCKLDENGNLEEIKRFRPDEGMPPSSWGYHPPFINYVGQGQAPRAAYEFRSGRLIKGELRPGGNFVPDVGSTVIKFEDYRYSEDAIPIWNLPGYFKKKSDLTNKEKEKIKASGR